MSTHRSPAALAAIVGGVLLAPSAAADHQSFSVRNNSATAIWYIYVTPSWSFDWEEDVLGNGVLDGYSEIYIRMDGYPADECWFDIRLVDEGGEAWEYYDVDLCIESYVDFP